MRARMTDNENRRFVDIERLSTKAVATENTVLGPFYIANPPHYENGHNICLDGKGEPMVVRGCVTNAAGAPIAGATVDDSAAALQDALEPMYAGAST